MLVFRVHVHTLYFEHCSRALFMSLLILLLFRAKFPLFHCIRKYYLLLFRAIIISCQIFTLSLYSKILRTHHIILYMRVYLAAEWLYAVYAVVTCQYTLMYASTSTRPPCICRYVQMFNFL